MLLLKIQVERQITAAEALGGSYSGPAMTQQGTPGYMQHYNGPKFIATNVQQGLSDNRNNTTYIDLGSPCQNRYIESFHSRFHGNCLSRVMRLNLREARVVIARWRQHQIEKDPVIDCAISALRTLHKSKYSTLTVLIIGTQSESAYRLIGLIVTG